MNITQTLSTLESLLMELKGGGEHMDMRLRPFMDDDDGLGLYVTVRNSSFGNSYCLTNEDLSRLYDRSKDFTDVGAKMWSNALISVANRAYAEYVSQGGFLTPTYTTFNDLNDGAYLDLHEILGEEEVYPDSYYDNLGKIKEVEEGTFYFDLGDDRTSENGASYLPLEESLLNTRTSEEENEGDEDTQYVDWGVLGWQDYVNEKESLPVVSRNMNLWDL